ncbi:GAF domain-containing protein [Hymenobacter sp. BT559]|uniref:GAF domain-containing protein n=1 Tax=Hymenobacter sp. BT559 TaxID=2795729 RepID=UPI0018EBC9F3|nr:GAF domain-containing protein [Hymenobacter sp. BT559]MBJ6142206.1 GAF domain-containing protein [Hymenobacter sp. BT559]
MSAVHAPEAERLASLRHYDVVPFLREDVFEEFAELTARIFSLPICLFNLADAHHITTEACYGLPDVMPQPRAEALCSSVVAQNQVVVYHDLTAATPTPTDAVAIQATLAKGIRFYAAAPVRLANQHCIGTLCLLDQWPREFTAEEQHVLQCLADLVSQAIMMRHHCHTTPGLGQTHWQALHTHLHDEVSALGALVRYLTTRYGNTIPVAEEVLHLVLRRLADLRVILQKD